MQRRLTRRISLLAAALIALLLLLLRELLQQCLLHRIHLEGQHPSQVPGCAADRAAQPGLSEDAAYCASQGLTDLAQQVAEESLRRELLHLLKLLKLLLQLLNLLLNLLLKLLLHLLRHLLRHLLWHLLLAIRLLHRVGLEGQQLAQLSGGAADRAAQSGLPEDAADGTTEWLTYLPQQVAEESLGGELLHLLLLQLLCIGLLQLLHGVCLKGQQAAADTAGHLTDLTAQTGITKQAADAFTDQPAQRPAEHAAKQALRRQLLSTIAAPLLNTIHGRSSCLEMKRMSQRRQLAPRPMATRTLRIT